MLLLTVLLWTVLAYAAWHALRAGWAAWVESFTGIPGDRRDTLFPFPSPVSRRIPGRVGFPPPDLPTRPGTR